MEKIVQHGATIYSPTCNTVIKLGILLEPIYLSAIDRVLPPPFITTPQLACRWEVLSSGGESRNYAVVLVPTLL